MILAPQRSIWAVVSLVLALFSPLGLASQSALGPILGMILGALAVACGGLALRDISLGGSSLGGSGLALAGIIIGGAFLLANLFHFTATGCAPMQSFLERYEKAGETGLGPP